MKSSRPWLLASAPILAVVLSSILLHGYHVLSKEPAPATYDAVLYHLRVFGVGLKVIPEVKPSADVLNSYLLVVGSTIAFAAAVLIRLNRPEMVRAVRFLGLAGVGTLFLAADELLAFHENLGLNLPWLADLPGVTHPDDPIPVLYGLVALLVIVRFRDVILPARRAVQLFGVAGALFAGAAMLDLANLSQTVEDLVEVASTCTGLVAFGALLVHHLRLAGVVPASDDATGPPRAEPVVGMPIRSR